MSNPMIEYQNVSIKFGRTLAVRGVNFSVDKGDFLNIIGPNGAGKTTLIKSLIKAIKPATGKIIINSNNLGYVPQKISPKPHFPLTVLELIYMGEKHANLRINSDLKTLVKSFLNLFELEESILNEKVTHLSGGELQRVYVIRALLSNPEVLILDEPTSAIDHHFRQKFYELLNDIKKKQDMTIIHITHDLTDVVLDNSKVLYIDEEVKFFGTYEQYKDFEHEGHHHG
ncbi:MAG TPA: metal ABC transporter ATP-binding protein [Acholeplasma sp.]|jgi:zinc transport system ATP-binding protein